MHFTASKAVKWDPGVAASRKAERISIGEFKERAESEEFARLYSLHSGMLMEHAMTRSVHRLGRDGLWAATNRTTQSTRHKVDVRNLFPGQSC
jgi:hypothetical protein